MTAELLTAWINQDRDRLAGFLADLVRAPSPYPDGNTSRAAAVVSRYLAEEGLDVSEVGGADDCPNLVSSLSMGDSGRHIVLNGRLETYPAVDAAKWRHDPFGGVIDKGDIYGCGASDMKAGTAALAIAYGYLSRLGKTLNGKLTFTAVSEAGTSGSAYLLEKCDVKGDCLLSAEPGEAPATIGFGEKGSLKLRFAARTMGCHGAYTHKSKSANKLAASLICSLEELTKLKAAPSGNVLRLLEQYGAELDRVAGPGASRSRGEYTVNAGFVQGGVKTNMLPAACDCEVEIGIPIGGSLAEAEAAAREIAARIPEVEVSSTQADEPNWSDPDHPLLRALKDSCSHVTGRKAAVVTMPRLSAARHWRAAGVPAFSFGTTATNVGRADERTNIDEWVDAIKIQALSLYALLDRSSSRA
jgi:succinyl-diaminopimelate desuccinylase